MEVSADDQKGWTDTKAVTLKSRDHVEVEETSRPTIQEPSDAIVRVTSSSICRTDLKILHGDYQGKGAPKKTGIILGHEGVGIIEEVGSRVKKVKRGSRVVIFNNTQCGVCFYCLRGIYSSCSNGGFLLGNAISGTQTEFVRVPHAEMGLYEFPDSLEDEDVLHASCISSTAFFAVENADLKLGDTVAVFGVGPVGQCVISLAKLFGAGTTIAVDTKSSRLELARKLGADVTINPESEDCIEGLRELTDGHGVDVSIEAAGLRATYTYALNSTRPGGCVSLLGQFRESQELPIHEILGKNLRLHWGFCNTNKVPELLRFVQNGKLNLRQLFTHAFPLIEAVRGYEVFENMLDNCMKVVLKP
ncbi:MAG: zinc-binding dehydrogenase [Candidatus Bathyarchaeia archaeon]